MTVEDAKPDVATHKLTTRHSLSPQPSCKQTRLHSCHHSRGFAVKARISSSESNTCRRLLFSAHLFLLALCSTHRAGDLLLITSSSSSGSCRGIYFLLVWCKPPIGIFFHHSVSWPPISRLCRSSATSRWGWGPV